VPVKALSSVANKNPNHIIAKPLDLHANRHDEFPNNPTSHPVNCIRHDCPYALTGAIGWDGKIDQPTPKILAPKLKEETDPRFIPFIGFLKNEDRVLEFKNNKGFENKCKTLKWGTSF
jgi:hypothetical protein